MNIENVSKVYHDTVALDRISLYLEEGEITAVLGESGAGKTTLLNAIAGLISFEGAIDGRTGRKVARREGCSYLLQDDMLLPNLTVEENLKFVLPKGEWGGIPAMIERVGLSEKISARPKELSGGQRRRVAIARAFLFPHDLLLMDEPFSSLDLSLKKSLVALVYELWRECGGTVVFVTHDVREACLLSRRAIVLKGGKLVGDVPVPAPYPRDFFAPQPQEEALVRALTDN